MSDWISTKILSSQTTKLELLSSLLENYDISGIEEISDGIIIYYQNEDLGAIIRDTCNELNIEGESIQEIHPKTNWNKEWESNFQPVTIDELCVVYAHFHKIDLSTFQYRIQITPQMSFGTGHHTTTRLMIRAMNKINFQHSHVLDFGTGTGILAIFAHLLGAKQIRAIDNSEWAINNAMQNAEINQVHSIEFIHADHTKQPGPPFDIIVINIIRRVILENLDTIKSQIISGGHLFLSGFLTQDGGKMKYEVQKRGFTLVAEYKEENWLCLHYIKDRND